MLSSLDLGVARADLTCVRKERGSGSSRSVVRESRNVINMPFLVSAWSRRVSQSSFSSYFAQVLNQRATLLSNCEVLQLLRELKADHIARTRTAQHLKKEEEDAAAVTGYLVLLRALIHPSQSPRTSAR